MKPVDVCEMITCLLRPVVPRYRPHCELRKDQIHVQMQIPCVRKTYLMAKIASASGRHGLSTILATRLAPLPLRSEIRVVDACALNDVETSALSARTHR